MNNRPKRNDQHRVTMYTRSPAPKEAQFHTRPPIDGSTRRVWREPAYREEEDYYEEERYVRPARTREKPYIHPFLPIGIILLSLVLLWFGINALFSWWQVMQDDWHYGRPRTYQVDAVVGHHDSAAHPSHFIALNLRGAIEVIECPGGDCMHAKIYTGPSLLGQGQDLVPVTLHFADTDGDGKPDMVMTVQSATIIYHNTGVDGFTPPKE